MQQRMHNNTFSCMPNTLNEMSNENKSIHDFDFNLICEFFSSMERQGPGSPDVTRSHLQYRI